jgi:hypothetical protein
MWQCMVTFKIHLTAYIINCPLRAAASVRWELEGEFYVLLSLSREIICSSENVVN